MPPSLPERRRSVDSWHLDKKVPIAIIAAIFVQCGTVIWWAASVDKRIETLEGARAEQASLIVRTARLEENVNALKESSVRIERKLDYLIENKRR